MLMNEINQDTLEAAAALKPQARVICDSISPQGVRLTTMEIKMHRFVLAEFNTHRVFSRNSASSRAIPAKKQRERVLTNPALPVFWGANQSGMSADAELTGDNLIMAKKLWLELRDICADYHQRFEELGLHKQLANRVIEVWQWHNVIVTSTQWSNFFGQRCNKYAQPEMRAAAEAAELKYFISKPEPVSLGEWHLPFIMEDEKYSLDLETLKKISVARCARVSYLTHGGIRDSKEDIAFYDRLVSASPMHASPLEHVATPASGLFYEMPVKGNLKGWHQLRHTIPGNTIETYTPTNPEIELLQKIFGTDTPSIYST
jgi:thymidylate synthase ThyX